ncbi:MAG: tetratricopeptide repeat protein [Alphaproteobacteria bacterium]
MRIRHATLCALVSVSILAGCANDALVDSLHPTAAEKEATPPSSPAGTVAALTRLGDTSRARGDGVSAVAFYRRAHAIDRFNAAPLIGLGQALGELGAYNDAAAAFREALVAAPVNADALRGLGNSLLALNQPALAIDQFEAALRQTPDARSHNGIGVARDRLGDHAGAQAAYRAGLALAPDDPMLLNNLGLSQAAAGDLDAAIGTLEQAVGQPGATSRQRQNLALVYGLAGRMGEAEKMARTDLDDRSVAVNLASYERLRGLLGKGFDPTKTLETVMGARAVTR